MQGTKIRLLADGLLVMATAGCVQADALQPDPAWQQGTLSSGLQWQVLTTPRRPSDRVRIRLLVNTGSLAESAQQSSYSHTIPHITLTQSDGLDAAQARSLWWQGIDSKRPIPSIIVSYNTTLFSLSLPNNRNDLLKEALSYLADTTGKLTITPETISHTLQGRGMVAAWPADTKEDWWRYHLKGSTLLGHDPADPLKQPIEAGKAKDFCRKWYTPDAMTLLVMGNVDARSVIDQINKTFDELKGKREMPAPVPMLSPLRTEAVSIMTDVVCQDRLSIMQDTPWQPIRESAALLRYQHTDLAHEALFWHIQQALSASSSRNVGLGFDYRVLCLCVQCIISIGPPNDKLSNNLNLVARELTKVHDKGLPEEEFNALMAQKKLELQELFAAYARTDTDIPMGQRMRSLQNQVVDIAPKQYQKLRQDFLDSLTVEVLNQDLRRQLSSDMALILLQPKGEPELSMEALQTVWDQIIAPFTATTATSVATDGVRPKVTDIPPAQ